MKKTPRKLVLHRQTLRVLSTIEVDRVVGGFDSGNVRCPAVVDSGRVACDTFALAIATAACG